MKTVANGPSLRNTKEPIEEIVVKLLRDGTSPDVANELAEILSTLIQNGLLWLFFFLASHCCITCVNDKHVLLGVSLVHATIDENVLIVKGSCTVSKSR